MGRILFWIIVGLLFWLVWRGMQRASRSREASPRSAEGEDMVACARCGVHLPMSETREVDGQRVCRDNPRCLPR